MSGGISDLRKSRRIRKNHERMTDALIKYLATGEKEDFERLEEVVDKYIDNTKVGYWGSSSGSVARQIYDKFLESGYSGVTRDDIGEFLNMLRQEPAFEALAFILSVREDPDLFDFDELYSDCRTDRINDFELVGKWKGRIEDFIENHDFGCMDGSISMDEVERFLDFYDVEVWYNESSS